MTSAHDPAIVAAARELDLSRAVPYAIPLRNRFRRTDIREGVLIPGMMGWGEFCPFPEYDDAVAAHWLATAVEAAQLGWPAPVRDEVEVNVTVPVVDPTRARDLVLASGARTAKVKVADTPDSLDADRLRLEAVRAALGPAGAVRIDANAAWDVETALAWIPVLDKAAGGLQYVEQPCPTVAELAAVRAGVDVPVAADESIRTAADPLAVAVAGAADVAVIKCSPLGGVRRALAVAGAAGLPVVVSSALETGVGMAAQLALAGCLPELDLACGLGTVALFTVDALTPPVLPRNGRLAVPTRPPVPGADDLDRVRQRDPERARWWLDRVERARRLLVDAPA